MPIQPVRLGVPVQPAAVTPMQREFEELRQYVMKSDRRSESEAERARVRSAFSDYEKAANNMGQPELAKAFAVGGQLAAVYGAMSAAAAAGMTASTVVPAVGAAILLISMFAAMDSGGNDALQQLQRQMKDNFVQVNAKLAEMEAVILRNHAEDLHEFTKVRYDIRVAREGLSAHLSLTQDEVRETRGDLHVQVERVADRIDVVAKAVSYSLDELRLDKLRDTVDAIKHYELRGGMQLEKLKRKVAYLERWLATPPGNKMLTGEYYAGTPDQGKYIEKSSLTGRIGLLAKAVDQEILPDTMASLVDIDTFNDVLPTYVKAVKLLRAAGDDYDPRGEIWYKKVAEPIEMTGYIGELFQDHYKKYAGAICSNMQKSYVKATQSAKDLLEARSKQLADNLERELREDRERMLLDMASVPNVETRDPLYTGGWCVPFPWKAGPVLARLPGQRVDAIHYSALKITSFNLVDGKSEESNLKGRFARLLPARDDVYIYPTYLPLEVLPLTPQIKAGLRAEKLGLGRLQVEARLLGRFEGHAGRYMYAPGHAHDRFEFPTDPHWISLQWSFVDTKGKEFALQDDRFSLNYTGFEHCPAPCLNNATDADRTSWTWNGDALSTSVFSRWLASRVDLKEDDIEATFKSCEASSAALFVQDRSQVIRFPAKRGSEWTQVNTLQYNRMIELRRELLDPAKGDAIKKEILRSSVEEIKEFHILIHALKEHVLGPQPCAALATIMTDSITSSPIVFPREDLDFQAPPISAYMQKHATLLNKIAILRAEILAVPVTPPQRPQVAVAYDPRVDALAGRVDDLTEMLRRRNAEIALLMAQLTRQMAAQGGVVERK